MLRRVLVVLVLVVTFAAGQAWADGSFSDVDPSSGHANNINAIRNAGITLGCNQAGTNYCPNDNVRRDQMASFLARAMGISSGSTKNFPKANGRSAAQAYCALAAASPGSFREQLCAPSVNVVDGGTVRQGPSVAIGRDGLPVLSYIVDGAVQLAHCDDPQCAISTSVTLQTGVSGQYTSVAINGDGAPVVAYASGAFFRLAVCSNPRCTNGLISRFQPFAVDTEPVSVAVKPDGVPVFSYYYSSAQFGAGLLFYVCSDVACSQSNGPSTLGHSAAAGISSNGKPTFAFVSDTGAVRLHMCQSADCVNPSSVERTIDAVGEYPSVATGSDGNSVVAYSGGSQGELRVAHCNDAACTAPTITTIPGASAAYTSIAIGTDGLPVIAFHAPNPGDLRVVRCANITCTSSSTTILDSSAITGVTPSIAVGFDGVPTIAYYQLTGQDLKVARLAVS